MNDTLREYLPQVRCNTELKKRLWLVAQRSVTKELADHIRLAVERYVAEEERRMALLPAEAPQAMN